MDANKPKVGLFVTCLVDLYRPNIAFAAIRLLENAGCIVAVPRMQTCCGQPAFNSGDYQTAREIAKQVIQEFESYDYIVGPSGSCMGTIKTHYQELFADEPEWLARSEALAKRCFELLSFLTDVMDVGEVKASFSGIATYHDSCSGLRELNVKQQPRQLLSSVLGLSLKEMNDSEVCCGFGGTFCVKYPEISTRLVSNKAESIDASEADVILGGDLGCLMNISGRLTRLGKNLRVYHAAEVLADMADVPGIGEAGDSD